MSAAKRNQQFNTTYFFSALALSIILMAAGGFAGWKAMTHTAGNNTTAAEVCDITLKRNDVQSQVSDSKITGTLLTFDGVESAVNRVGVLSAACPGFSLTSFCAGNGCKKPGVTFSLE